MNSYYKYIANINIILVILVIAAGSIVRTTQSGMGCPDWPTCYGLIIPPISVTQLPINYQQLYANEGIDAEAFDVLKTWIEYLNRLLGALLGLFVLIQTGLAIRYRKSHPTFMYSSIALLLLTGFQGWLGALVVSSNLAPYRITIHMLFAFIILLIASYVLAKTLNFMQREIWIDNLSAIFPIHRSFSLLILGVNGWILWKCRKQALHWKSIHYPAFLLGAGLLLSTFSGIVMTYLSVPAFMQPVHLTCASIIIFALHRIMLEYKV